MTNVISLQRARMEREQDAISSGFIKLHRSIQDSAFKRDPERFALWVHMLLEASHKPFRTTLGGQVVELQAGQFVSGIRQLSEETGVSFQRVRSSLDLFEREGMIARDTSRRSGTVFTVLEYADNQGKNGVFTNTPATHQIITPINTPQPSNYAASGESATHQSTHQQHTESSRIQEYKNTTDTNVSVVETAAAESTVEQVEKQTTDHTDQPSASGRPACPHRKIITLYNEILPELTQVQPELWGGSRAKALAARWRESTKHQSLEFWKRFFTKLRDYPWYFGENDRGWTADLEWIVTRRNFVKLLEKFIADGKKSQGGARHA